MSYRRVCLSIAVLIGLGCWSEYTIPAVDLNDILNDPDAYDGTVIEGFMGWGAVSATTDGFVLERNGRRVFISAKVGSEPIGIAGWVRGIFRSPNRIEAQEFRYPSDTNRAWKIRVSLIPCALLPFLLLVAIRFDRARRALVLRTREDA